MFDIGWSEFFVVALLILVVLGPKELPRLFYEIGKWVRYVRALALDFQMHIDQMVQHVELEELKKEVDRLQHLDFESEMENKEGVVHKSTGEPLNPDKERVPDDTKPLDKAHTGSSSHTT